MYSASSAEQQSEVRQRDGGQRVEGGHDLAVVLEHERVERLPGQGSAGPAATCRRRRGAGDPGALGSMPSEDHVPWPTETCAAMGWPPLQRGHAAPDELAGERGHWRRPGGQGAQERGEVARAGRRWSRSASTAAGPRGARPRPRCPVWPPTMTSRPPAPTHVVRASSCSRLRRAGSTSCHTSRSMAAHASARGGRSSGDTVTTRAEVWPWRGDRPDTRCDGLGPLGDDEHGRGVRLDAGQGHALLGAGGVVRPRGSPSAGPPTSRAGRRAGGPGGRPWAARPRRRSGSPAGRRP